MNPLSLVLTPQKLLASIAGAAIWTFLSAGAGYLYHAHRAQVAAAAQEAKQETITDTVGAAASTIDSQAVLQLGGKLIAATNQAAALRAQIKAQAHETPPPPDCRLPDRLRDAINNSLAPGEEGTAGQVR